MWTGFIGPFEVDSGATHAPVHPSVCSFNQLVIPADLNQCQVKVMERLTDIIQSFTHCLGI